MTASFASASESGAVRKDHRPLDGARWYAVQSLPRREVGAQLQLAAQGFRAFLPLVAATTRRGRKLKTLRAPAFPGYLFVNLDLECDRWRSVNGTFGVARLIMGDGRPLAIPHGVVETLLDYVDETGLCRFDRNLEVGQPVRVTMGPLANAMGKLTRVDAGGRVRVLLEIMGSGISATLDRSALVAA